MLFLRPDTSKQGKIMPYSPVNIIDRIMSRPASAQEFLDSVEKIHVNKKVLVILR